MSKITITNTPPVLVATSKEITNLMNKLGCSRREAEDIIRADREVDKMTIAEAQADLTAEQKKAVKSATISHSRKRTTAKKERKIDNIKKRFLGGIKTYLEGCGAIITKEKTETELTFSYEGDSYSVKLIKHRPPKS